MKNLDAIKKLRNNANEIYTLFNILIPKWKADPKHYDKVGWGFCEDTRFNACSPVNISFASYKGVYGDSGCSTQLSLDTEVFSNHLVKYLNDHKEEIMLAIADSIELQAKGLKSEAEKELNEQLEKLKELDAF